MKSIHALDVSSTRVDFVRAASNLCFFPETHESWDSA